MPEAKVSVVIPTYNCARYLAAAVDSVLAQTYRPWEIIIVDDGSTDSTAQVLTPYSGAIKYLYQENRGEPAARNLGLRNATGEFIACLDADDSWLPDKLELQMGYFATHPTCDFVYTDTLSFDDTGVLHRSLKAYFNQTFPSGNIFCQLFRETIFGSGSVVFRKGCMEKVGYFNEQLLIGSDYEMWLRMARHFEAGYIDKPLLMYRQHPTMSTRRLRTMRNGVPWEVAVLKQTLEHYPEAVKEIGKNVINQRLAKAYATLAYDHFKSCEYPDAHQVYRKALSHWPGHMRYWLLYFITFLRPSEVAPVRKMVGKLRTASISKGVE
jgi:glycosyltransferase involved in cell wall biosynthesis